MEIVYEGALVKAPPQGTDVLSGFKRWKRRHFRLRKDTLEYYADASGLELKGMVQLNGVTKLEKDVLHAKYEHAFSLVTADREYIFAADSRKLMDEWITHLQKMLQSRVIEECGTDGDYMNLENVKEYQREQQDTDDPPPLVERASTVVVVGGDDGVDVVDGVGVGVDNKAHSSQSTGAEAIISDTITDTNTEANTDTTDAGRRAKVRAKFDFDATTKKQLTIHEGEVLEVIDNGALWWIVRNSKQEEGLAPSNFLDPI